MSNKHYYKWDEEKQLCTGYIRHGECKQCGACCRMHIVCRIANEFTSWRGIWFEVTSDNGRTFFKTEQIVKDKGCHQLGKDNICKEYEERRVICAEWPFNPTDLEHFPNCGYSFEENGKWTYEEIEE